MASLEDWCLDRSATEAEFPAGESNSALWVKSPVHHAPMLARDESPPGRSRTSVIPRIRRVLEPGLSYGRKIRWGGLEPPPRGPQPRALPGELRTCENREEGKEKREQGVPPEGVEPPRAQWPTTF